MMYLRIQGVGFNHLIEIVSDGPSYLLYYTHFLNLVVNRGFLR